MANAESVINLLLQSVSHPVEREGKLVMTYDPEDLRYRFLAVDSDNLSAYVRAHKDVLTWCKLVKRTFQPGLCDDISDLFKAWSINMMTSISAKGSENGKMLKMLLADKHEMQYTLQGESNSSVLDKIKQHTGENNPVRGVQGAP